MKLIDILKEYGDRHDDANWNNNNQDDAAKLKVTKGPGFYLLRNDKKVAGPFANEKEAMDTWNDLKNKGGIKIKRLNEAEEVMEEVDLDAAE
jgi:hypothetical protein